MTSKTKTARACLILLLAALLLPVLSLGALASGQSIDLDTKGSITLHFAYEGKPLAGGKLTLRQVAEVKATDTGLEFAWLPAMKSAGIPMKDLESPTVAKKVADAADKGSLPSTTAAIGKDGTVSFKDLPLGLYLLTQPEAPAGFECIRPFLMGVPGKNDKGGYVYDVDGAPKPQVVKATPSPSPSPSPTPIPEDPSKPPKLPQTGQLKWPIAVMAVAGLVLTALGTGLRISARRYDEGEDRR